MHETMKLRIKAVDKANHHANKLLGPLVDALRPFLGLKIVKADGTLVAKAKIAVDAAIASVKPDGGNFRDGSNFPHVYRSTSSYSLGWTIKTCESTDRNTVYHETYLYVGELGGEGRQMLTKFSEPVIPLRDDYSENEIEKLQKAADEKEEEWRKAVDKIPYQFRQK